MKTKILLTTIILLMGCSKQNPLIKPKFAIGDCFEENHRLITELSNKGIFIYKVLEIEPKPKTKYLFLNETEYGYYTTDTIYEGADGEIHSVKETPSFELDSRRSKVDCPPYKY